MKDYKQYFIIPAEPELVYLALTRADTIMLWTGYPAVMSEEEGSEFSLWDESIVGKNLEFEKNKKIVQEWYFGDQKEASIVTMILHPKKDITSVELRHTNIPDEVYDEMIKGWKYAYFKELREFYSD